MNYETLPITDCSYLDMADFPQFCYSMGEVRRAGQRLAEELRWSDDESDEIREVFRIANNWIDAHAFPTRSMRFHMIRQARRLGLSYVSAGRVKRISSVRKKLRRIPIGLDKIQDLGGCRIILSSMEDVQTLVVALRSDSPHDLRKEDDYITQPKNDGYRSHHLMFSYCGEGKRAVYHGRRIEVQVRTRLQHSWATAVEAAGFVLDQDFKGGQGNEDWRRLFLLMSAVIAATEGCPIPNVLRGHGGIQREIADLNGKLSAIDTLEHFRTGVRYIDNFRADQNYKPRHYLIEYDVIGRTVNVRPFESALLATEVLEAEERSDRERNRTWINRVLVEVDKVANLRDAYPNYFGDIAMFNNMLATVASGGALPEYTMAPQPVAPRIPAEAPDLSWFYQGKHRKWSEDRQRRQSTQKDKRPRS